MLVPMNRGSRSLAIWVGYSLLAAAIFSFGVVAVALIETGKLSALPGIVRTVAPWSWKILVACLFISGMLVSWKLIRLHFELKRVRMGILQFLPLPPAERRKIIAELGIGRSDSPRKRA